MDKAYLQAYLQAYPFQPEAVEVLLAAMDAVCADEKMEKAMADAVWIYEKGGLDVAGMQQLVLQIREKAEGFCVPTQTVEILFFLLCTRHLKELYLQKDLPMAYYDGVASDLISKLQECHQVMGIWGSFVATWFAGFFVLDRFPIGRLQFEMRTMPAVMSADGKYCFNGEPAINVHIPSGRPLDIAQAKEAMEEAAKVFGKYFAGDKVLFLCNSWLLYPGHYTILPPESRIRQFMDLFTIVNVTVQPEGNNLWRIFNTHDIGDLAKLPRDTALQRSYLNWMEQGKPVGVAIGFRELEKPCV